MKTISFSRVLFVAAFVASLLFTPAALKAQSCPGTTIQNSTNCEVKAMYSYDCLVGGVCSTAGVTIPANSTFNVPFCNCSGGQCRLTVTVQRIDIYGVSVTVNQVNPNGNYPLTYCPGCSGTVTWVANAVTIQ